MKEKQQLGKGILTVSTSMTTTTTTKSSLYVESTPLLSCETTAKWVGGIVVLKDDSLVLCSSDNTARRWMLIDQNNNNGNGNDFSNDNKNNNNQTLQLLGTFVGHSQNIRGVVEKDDNTIITGSIDKTMKVWNKTTCQCLKTLELDVSISRVVKTKNNSCLICGFFDGVVQMRGTTDLELLSSFKPHSAVIWSICELKDGSFVSGSDDGMVKRWNEAGEVLQSFPGDSDWSSLLELRPNIIVMITSHCYSMRVQNLSTGECICIRNAHSDFVCGLVKIAEDKFLSASFDKKIKVWNEQGNCIETIKWGDSITAIARHRDTIVTASIGRIEFRRLQ